MQRLLLFFTMFLVTMVAKAQPQPPTATWSADGKTVTLTIPNEGKELDDWLKNEDNRTALNAADKLVVVCTGNNIKLDLRKLLGPFTEGADNISALEIPYIDLTDATFEYNHNEKRTITNTNVKGVKLGNADPTAIIDASNYDDLVVARNNQVTAKCATDGNLAGFMAAFSDEDFDKLTVTGTLGSEDAGALNATAVDASGATMTATTRDIKGTAQYLSLPGEIETTELATLKTNNPNLDLAMSISDLNTTTPKLTMHSFTANSLSAAKNALGNGSDVLACKYVSMSGTYGDHDLVDGTSKNLGNAAVWDFTGANFEACTMPSLQFEAASEDGDGNHYDINDPFKEHPELIQQNIPDGYQTNAFYQFNQYATDVVEIKLPDDKNMTILPPKSIAYLGSQNKTNYQLIHGLTDEEFAAQFPGDNPGTTAEFVPIEDLVITDNYIYLDFECGVRSKVSHLVIGGNVKEVRAGAFGNSTTLSDLDFGAGLRDCKIGALAFGECKSMKHIALSEGIVSVGASAFSNSIHLESIRLPQTLVYIGNEAFKNCLALNSITIPENVERIGQKAFALCPFTDIFLTTTDPAKIPMVWSAGTGISAGSSSFDANCTFNHGHIDGWEGGVQPAEYDAIEAMTFDEAASYYYMNWNGLPVLHYPEELAPYVHAEIAETYGLTSSDGYGLPVRDDIDKRGNIAGADLGSPGQGKYTRDGWAQFLLMKEFSTEPGGDLFTKEYDDVWYTICFPFDLTDEQLAAAFNETFNIVDFSGVEILDEDDPKNTEGKKTLILHFNTVALTYYKDPQHKVYTRKTYSNGKAIREKAEESGFEYNIYTDDQGVEYHHVWTAAQLKTNKTKTFAPGSSMADAQNHLDQARIIDGILASAGHPYMVHPAIGTKIGDPKRRCDFAGITWEPMTSWPTLFEDEKREVDLGVQLGNPTTNTPDEDNYLQAAYSDYAGQTYTFKGNAEQYSENCPEEPYVGHGLEDYPAKPTKADYPTEPTTTYPDEPIAPTEPTITLADFQTQNEPAVVADPGITWTDANEALYAKLTSQNSWELVWYGETTITADYNDGTAQWNAWTSKKHLFQGMDGVPDPYADEQGCFELCKTTFNNKAAIAAYSQYLLDKAAYDEAYAQLEDEWDAYNAYIANPQQFNDLHAQWEQDCQDIDTAHDQWVQDCQDIDAAYETALANWEDECDAVDTRNAAIHAAWEDQAVSYQKLIPTGAYFLGRKGTNYPKFYREIADDTRTDATGGFWTLFTAVIIPNDAAIAGIEAELGEGQAASANQSVEMVFDESFTGDFVTTDEIEQIITEAEEKGQKVEYMQVVYNINGQIVREGTELTGLPKGIYIVNGKKYFVK